MCLLVGKAPLTVNRNEEAVDRYFDSMPGHGYRSEVATVSAACIDADAMIGYIEHRS